MGLIATIRRLVGMIFKKQAEEDFQVKSIMSPHMEHIIDQCARAYIGKPTWMSPEDRIKTVNFAKSICSETARLTTLAIGIKIEGSPRAEWLQQQIDKMYPRLRDWVEYGCAFGTVFLKPNGETVDVFTPSDILLIECDNVGVSGIVFKDSYTDGSKYYTRLEYHRFKETTIEGVTLRPYYVSNRTYVSKSPESIGDPVPINRTKWRGMMEQTPPIIKANGEPIDGPMFGMLRTPQANNVDISSPMGLPVYAEAMEELEDLDVAYSRLVGEIGDSEKIILADERLMFGTGKPIHGGVPDVKLPHYVKNVFGNESKEFYQEINPQLNTDIRIAGINNLLSQIGYKAGFSNGYFVFNEKSGMVTATQVESDDRRTIQYVKDVRDKLESALDGLIYALNVYADLYGLSPAGEYETTYDFGDITYNREEDRARWWQYVVQGKVPAWLYFNKFEGMSEEDAKAMVEEAQPDDPKMFGEE